MVVKLNISAKCCEQIAQFSLQHDRSLSRATVHDSEIMLLGEVLDLVEIFLGGSMLPLQLLMGKVFPFRHRRIRQIVSLLGQRRRISPAERTRTVTLAISEGSIGPAGREFGNTDRLLPGSGT